MDTRDYFFKRSAIHNLRITQRESAGEGFVIPKKVLHLADIAPYEQIVVTRINGDNVKNRIVSFVVPGDKNGEVIAKGSLSKFLSNEQSVCVISYTVLDDSLLDSFKNNEIPIFDVGFNPKTKHRNQIANCSLGIEYNTKKEKDVKRVKDSVTKQRTKLRRIFLSNLVVNLRVTGTAKNCLRGSAEIPENVLRESGMTQYQKVYIYNQSRGGCSPQTYVISMPPGVVMMTGAMAKFAKKGDRVASASFVVTSEDEVIPKVLYVRDNRVLRSEHRIIC